MGYDSEIILVAGVSCKLNKSVFIMIKRSKQGKAVDFRHETFENKRNNCYIPKKRYCFVKCI